MPKSPTKKRSNKEEASSRMEEEVSKVEAVKDVYAELATINRKLQVSLGNITILSNITILIWKRFRYRMDLVLIEILIYRDISRYIAISIKHRDVFASLDILHPMGLE